MHHETVITVNDIDQCRYFYREILQLGTIVADSANMVVFELSKESFLVLQKSFATFLEHASSAQYFALEHPEFDKIKAALEANGNQVVQCDDHLGREAFRSCDPEGNMFMLLKK